MSVIQVDGSYLEGGGSIVRLASALSILTQKPVRIYNIRKKRPNPGLKTQHLRGLEALRRLCNGKLENAKHGSTEIFFFPNIISDVKQLDIKIETAGSIGLVLQSILIACLHLKKRLKINIEGGAVFGMFAPPLPYTNSVFLPILKKMGYNAHIDILKYGFYPSGGARTQVVIEPCKKLIPIYMKGRGNVKQIECISVASKHLKKPKVAERQARTAEQILKEHGYDCVVKTKYVDSICPGSGILLRAKTDETVLGASSIGEKGKKAEVVGEECAYNMLYQLESGAALDEWAGDQIIPYMAIAEGGCVSISRITKHLLTNIWVCEQFLPVRFDVKGELGQFGIVSVKRI